MPRSPRAVALLATALALGTAACSGGPARSAGAASAARAAAERPNVIVILADDMGYSDIGSYGGEIRTPNLDRLAAGGLRFRQFYNNAKCSPTRASLLTGVYPHQAGMGELAGDEGEPGPYQAFLAENTVTIAEALEGAGYRSYMSGKWHLGDAPSRWPRQRGFDRYFGLISGATSFWELLQEGGRERIMVLEDERWSPPATGYYATDAYSDYAVERILEHDREHGEQPFFLYLAYTAPHFPLHAPEEDIRRYESMYAAGWDRVRAERYQRMRRMGIVDARHALTPREPTIPAWDTVSNKAEWTRLMATYAAMIDRMDQGIGRVVSALERTGELDNTLILFLSDNGGTQEDVSGRRLNDPNVPIGARGSYVAYKEPWAHVSNTPYRLYKNWLHEGGVVTPLVAHWPAGIRQRGEVTDAWGHVIDVLPTVLDIAGVRYPEAYEGRPVQAVQGVSLLPALRGQEASRPEPVFWAYGGHWAVRDGAYKLVYDRTRSRRVELFNLEADPTEQHDLSAQQPERAARMRAMWQAWADRVGAREAGATSGD